MNGEKGATDFVREVLELGTYDLSVERQRAGWDDSQYFRTRAPVLSVRDGHDTRPYTRSEF